MLRPGNNDAIARAVSGITVIAPADLTGRAPSPRGWCSGC